MNLNLFRKYLSFTNALSALTKGQAFMSNFLFDSNKKRLPKEIIKQYLGELIDSWEINKKIEEPEDIIRSSSNQLNPKKFFCKGPKIADQNTDHCSRIIYAQDIFTYKNIDLSKIGFLVTGRVTETQIRELEKRGLKGITKGDMTSRRSFVWATRTQEIIALRKQVKVRDIANGIRNKLGLLHFSKNEQIIEIVYPKAIVNDVLAAPTFIEGSPSSIYRSCDNADGWGRACEIETCEDGFSEAVHPKVSFGDNFMVKHLGYLTPPLSSFDQKRFLQTLKFKSIVARVVELAKYA